MGKRNGSGNLRFLDRFRAKSAQAKHAKAVAAAGSAASVAGSAAGVESGVDVEKKGPIVINPHSTWLQRLIEQPYEQAMSRNRLPTPENLQMELATCRTEEWLPTGKKWRCGRYRPFPGALVGSISPFLPKFPGSDPRLPPAYSRLILHELPESGHGPSWSHAQLLHQQRRIAAILLLLLF